MSTPPVHRPPASLLPFVDQVYGYRAPAMPTGVHRGLPSRYLTLVVELIEPLRVSGLGAPVTAHGVVGGLHTKPALIDASGPQEGLQCALTPLGAQALLGLPAAELAGRAVDLADVVGPSARDLLERLHDATSWPERFAVLDAALLRRLGDGAASVPTEVAEAWRLIQATHGRVPVSRLAQHVGWSRRHLSERFRLVTGLTPKQSARVARFEAARSLLLSASTPSLAQVATCCGYADQPHLAREWRELAGCSITTWLREELPFVQDTALAPGAQLPA